MQVLTNALRQVINQKFEIYNGMVSDLIKTDILMIISLAETMSDPNQRVAKLIEQLTAFLIKMETDAIAGNRMILFLSVRRYLRGILAQMEASQTETESQ